MTLETGPENDEGAFLTTGNKRVSFDHIERASVAGAGGASGISGTEVGSLVGFYSLYYDEPGGRYRIQVCTDLPCALRGAVAGG